jgi:hypothetical protein
MRSQTNPKTVSRSETNIALVRCVESNSSHRPGSASVSESELNRSRYWVKLMNIYEVDC